MLIAIAASLLANVAWAYLLLAHGGFWRTGQRLPPPGPAPVPWPAVMAVVPARDEAAILPETLPTLLAQDYDGPFSVLLVDDESSDGTGEVAAALGMEDQACPGRMRVLAGRPAPAGWAGKVWAMAQGLQAGADADYVLFTDADIAYAPGTLAALVRAATSDSRVLVSQMALLRTDTFAERLLIPAFVYFFAQLYPFRRVNRRGGRTAAAAGGCMLVRRTALEAAGGLDPIRGARIDDVALSGLLKRETGGDCWLGFTTEVVSRRRYQGLGEIWDMVARSAYTQLRYSPLALGGTVAGMIMLYLLPAGAAVSGLVLRSPWLAISGFAGWVIMSVTFLPALKLYRLSPARAASLPVLAGLYTAMTISSARRHRAGRGGEWKGRTVQLTSVR